MASPTDDENEQDRDDTPETPLDEPPPEPIQDPPAEPGPQGPYVVRMLAGRATCIEPALPGVRKPTQGQWRERVNPTERKERRGFASMSPERQREIASKGGRAAHAKGTAHEWTPDEARSAGRKGGQVSRGGRGRLPNSDGSDLSMPTSE
jgi:uncharacterized protein